MYRLHIDIPLGHDEQTAIKVANDIMQWCFVDIDCLGDVVEQVNYRLGHDEDRQKSNHLDKNENGHVSNKKSRINISG